jgi:hypothetical protein
VTLLYRETSPDVFDVWGGEAIDDVRHPLNIEQLWPDDELLAIGLYKPAPADPIPEGKMVTGTTVQRVEGIVKFVNTLADAPIPILTPYIYAIANLQVVEQDIWGIETAVNLAAAIWMDVGQYLVLFSEPQENTDYLAQASSGTSQALVVEKGTDYLLISASNAAVPFDPAEFSITVIRKQ